MKPWTMLLFLLANILMVLMAFSLVWEGLAWREVLSGRVTLDSLRYLTGIVDRMELVRRLGPHDSDMTFSAPVWQVLKARPLVRWVFGNKLLELFLVSLLWRIAWTGSGGGWQDLGIVIGYYLLGYGIYSSRVSKVHYQLVHEKLKKFGPKLTTGFRFDHLGSKKSRDDGDKKED